MTAPPRPGTIKPRSRKSAGRGESRTSPRRIAATEKQAEALELRKRGIPYAEIARQLGCAGPQGAYELVMSALSKMLQEPAAEVRQLEIERLDKLLTPFADKASAGDSAAADRVLRIMERRAKLLGLDAPVRTEVSDPGGTIGAGIIAAFLRARELVAREAPALPEGDAVPTMPARGEQDRPHAEASAILPGERKV